MAKCVQCGKSCEDCISMDGKDFCCPKCVKEYNETKGKGKKKAAVCEFC